mgnify:CR=1 FL=1
MSTQKLSKKHKKYENLVKIPDFQISSKENDIISMQNMDDFELILKDLDKQFSVV